MDKLVLKKMGNLSCCDDTKETMEKSTKKSTIHIHIYTIKGMMENFKISPTCSILDLKKEIRKHTGILEDRQHLVIGTTKSNITDDLLITGCNPTYVVDKWILNVNLFLRN
jgi:hypothetical protein